ncbi:unnamed protein product [Adineta steineri]|uniref:Uncharacterized protein n=1 Tax=Adineta steineri TaxID=433720 RepID=A0A819NN39_9BILA|nr:unnamed protein product [Adineta steineri]
MQTTAFTNRTRKRYHRFLRLFQRKKPSIITLTYSYENLMRFPRLPITVPPLVPTLMSYRWNDEDDCESVPKKLPQDNQYQQQARRRIPKRYSDVVGPTSTKAYLPRRDSATGDNQPNNPLSQRAHRRTSLKPNSTDGLYVINSHNKKSTEILSSLPKLDKHDQSCVTRRYNSKNKRLSTSNAVDLLAHRMQAAMSTELMHSLDRNFVFGDKKHASNCVHMNRSYSFNITTSPSNDWWEKPLQKPNHYHIIPRVKHCLDDERKSIETVPSIDEPTPDYDDDEIIIQKIHNDSNDEIGEEPIADYDDSTLTPEFHEKPVTPPIMYDLGVSSSIEVPQTSITPNSETYTQPDSSFPPTPPPLPNTIIESKNITVRCRTIADKITTDHKLILKDETETKTNVINEKQTVPDIQEDSSKKSHHNQSNVTKPCYLHLSQELLQKTTLRKVSHPVSRSYSTYGSMSHLNEHDTESTTLRGKLTGFDEQAFDGLSSSATTSIIMENEYEHRSSSKIYNDYKRRASSINISRNNTLNSAHSHSSLIHPIHTHIGLRSSTSSSSTIDKPPELTLSNKQMNVCVINQLNEHLSTRFRKQQQEICSRKTTNTIQEDTDDHHTYTQSLDDITNTTQVNLYDEPNHNEMIKTTPVKCPEISISSIPPPPPPLPVGGFRSILPQINRPSSSQRTSIMTLARESNGLELISSNGTSTTSSKLSDTQILRELRTNPLFTKAKQYLEIEPGSNGRRSGRRLNESMSYLRLDKCSKGTSSIPSNDNNNNSTMERFLMRPNELNTVINNNTPKRTNSRTYTKSLLETQRRQSELELIFQKRAQRSEQNLT